MSDYANAIDEFWRWFEVHRVDFDILADTEAPFWDIALGELKRLDEHLWFELSGQDDDPREFVITAEGHAKVFALVDEMVARAPKIPGWEFVPLKPAMGFDFETTYEGISFDPRTMWFLPLLSASRPQNLGLRIGVPGYQPENKRETDNAVLVILDTALGERVAALDVHYVEVVALPAAPEADGYIELPELGRYIEWRKRKLSGT